MDEPHPEKRRGCMHIGHAAVRCRLSIRPCFSNPLPISPRSHVFGKVRWMRANMVSEASWLCGTGGVCSQFPSAGYEWMRGPLDTHAFAPRSRVQHLTFTV